MSIREFFFGPKKPEAVLDRPWQLIPPKGRVTFPRKVANDPYTTCKATRKGATHFTPHKSLNRA